jgi:hypothetical protein
MLILVATLVGLLVGGVVCLYYLRSTIAGDIGPQLRRMHAEIDPQIRGMQNQLDNIESAVNLALASRYAELSQLTWPPAIPAARASEEDRH